MGITIILIIITILFLQKDRHEDPLPSVEQIENNREEVYAEFEKLYKESEDEWNKVIEEIKREGIYEQNTDVYHLYFEKKNIEGRKKDDSRKICYFDEGELKGDDGDDIKILNMNETLMNALEKIKQKGIVYKISVYPEGNLKRSEQIVEFAIKTEYTPFVKDNNGLMNLIAYCEDEECERFGYHKIDENWYVYIMPRPDE